MPNGIVRDLEMDELRQCNIPTKIISSLYIEFDSPKGVHYTASYIPNLPSGPVIRVEGSAIQKTEFMDVRYEINKKVNGSAVGNFTTGDRDISDGILLDKKKDCREIADIAERLREDFSNVKITFLSLKDIKDEYNIPKSRIDPKFYSQELA
jgi:hypothetical protein